MLSLQADLGKDAWCRPSGRCSGWGGDALGAGCPREGRGSAASAAPGQPAGTPRAGDGSVVGPEGWEDRDKPCKGKGLLVSEGSCVQGVSGCPGMGTPGGARVGEMLARLVPISCVTKRGSHKRWLRGLEQFTPPSTAVSPLRSRTVPLCVCAVL